MVNLITEHMDIWSAAQTQKSNGGRGRGKNSNGQSPHGIKKLRDLVLELAVRGKLVLQDSNDEPASVLLERIAKEKARLIKEGKIKKQKPFPKIGEDEKPFELPVGWEWTRLGNIGDWGAGATPNRKNLDFYGGDMPWLKSGELRDNENLLSSEETVTHKALKQCSLRVCNPGDVLIAMYGATIGMLAILNVIATTNQAVCACTCHSGIFNRYLFAMLKAWRPQFTGQGAGGAQPNISKVKIINTIAPIPPLAEQHRIVAKVDELMALCDQLEQQQTDSNDTHQTLVETLLVTLTSAADQKKFAKAWQRMANHFDTLFTTEQSIDQLKQTILQLAVMGKLISQDPNDEPASVLLEKIAKEKKRLVKEGKIKKQKPLPGIGEDEKPFGLPVGWELARLQTLVFLLGDGLHGTPDYTPGTSYYFVNGNNLNDGKIEIKPNTKTVSFEEILKHKKDLSSNAVLVSINGTLGKVAFYNGEKIILGKSACYFNPSENVSKYFIKVLIESQYFMKYAFSNATGTTIKNLSLKAMNSFPVPLPPTKEQNRIVSAVDELMALCDTLKERLNDAQTTQVQLADTIVERAVA